VDVQKELRLLSSCGNEVIVPWRNDTVPDAQFPASGPVYEEQVKWLPGIAAESRNFDANGQYVRSLANGAEYAYPLPDGRIFTTGLPLQGVNPPKSDPPEYKPEVPCETQVKPDLRSDPAAPPAGKRVNFNHPDVKAAWAKELPKALEFARDEFERMGIKTPILSDELSLDDIPALKKTFKTTGQVLGGERP
jgi:phospholipid/cholesterol/gamma-HCH transport system substrate-binding protein